MFFRNDGHCISDVVFTLAGTATSGSNDGSGNQAKFLNPNGLVLTSDGSKLYVADTYNNFIRLIDTATGK